MTNEANSLEVKDFFGDWHEVTKEKAAQFYELFMENVTAIPFIKRQDYFNTHHMRGGHVLMNGKVETTPEQCQRIFSFYKNLILKNSIDDSVRFVLIEYECRVAKLNPYNMAISLVKDGIKIIYDDASISKAENIKKEKKVNRLLSKS